MKSQVTFHRSKSDNSAKVLSPVPVKLDDLSVLDLICGTNNTERRLSFSEPDDSYACITLTRRVNSLGNLHSHSTREIENIYDNSSETSIESQELDQDYFSRFEDSLDSGSGLPSRAANPVTKDPKFQEIGFRSLRNPALSGILFKNLAIC